MNTKEGIFLGRDGDIEVYLCENPQNEVHMRIRRYVPGGYQIHGDFFTDLGDAKSKRLLNFLSPQSDPVEEIEQALNEVTEKLKKLKAAREVE